jgi:membrane protease YdiL (CAAX protease family)
MMSRRLLLSLECLVLFGGIPLWLTVLQLQGGFPFFPVLFLFLLITLVLGWRDPRVLFRPRSHPVSVQHMLLRFVAVGVFLTLFTWILFPDLFLRLPRERPGLWLMILCLYPLLSVAPQEFLFRTYFMQRYVPVFGDGRGMLWANAFFFGWAHLFFLNWVAPVLSLLGGLLITLTWQKTRSFKWVCIEHALYGQFVFTSGIGWWFYTGSAQSIQQITGS